VVSPTNPEGGARINVNQATVAQLEKLPGIGVVSAKKIAAWRTDNGSIRAVADLRAAGLTAAVLRKALPYLALG
jgi:competence protein ComEA